MAGAPQCGVSLDSPSGACLPAMSPDDLFNKLQELMNTQVIDSTDQHVDNPGGLDPRPDTGTERTITLKATPKTDHYAGTDEETITATEFRQRMIRAVAIMLAESGGIPNAMNVNGATSSAPGSIDRGLFQFNNKAFPWFEDKYAYSVPENMTMAYFVSRHFHDWGPWKGSRGLDNNSAQYKLAAATDKNRTGYAVPADDPLTGAAVAVGSAVGNVTDVLPSVDTILRVLQSGAFWRRFGIAALGVGLVILAVIFWKGDDAIAVASRGAA